MNGRYDRPLTPAQIASEKDESIDFSDIPELDEEFWSGRNSSSLIAPTRSPCASSAPCWPIFKAPGKGYQTRMNRVLESYVRHRTGESADTGEGAGH